MKRDQQRVGRITEALREEGWDALVCVRPPNVLLLSGYWPVLGMSAALMTRDGRIAVVCPSDEQELGEHGWADEVCAFVAGSLKTLTPPAENLLKSLAGAAQRLGLGRGARVGFEEREGMVPVSYSALYEPGAWLKTTICSAMPAIRLFPASATLERLRSVLTPGELKRVRAACGVAGGAFRTGRKLSRAGMGEPEVALQFKAGLSKSNRQKFSVQRADGWTWCMSGPNSADAYRAYARTRHRRIKQGDLVMVHCNSYADGFWTDVTRTYWFDRDNLRQRSMYQAVWAAFTAALSRIQPGARAAEIDAAAREELDGRGFKGQFKHGAGHGVGFGAISHDAPPRLHPLSPDVLETGMVFNLEPAIYVQGYGGLRHCNVVTVTANGAELLTNFQLTPESLILG